MPSELQRVAQGLVDVLDEIPRVVAYLQRTAQKYRENAAFIATANSTTARIVAMQLDEAARRCDEAAHYAGLAPPRARAWAEQMITGSRTAGPSHGSARSPDTSGGSGPSTKRQRDEPAAPESAKAADAHARDMARRLPVRVERRGHRDKTRGLWRDPNGDEQQLISGADSYRDLADRLAVEKKLGDPPHTLAVTSHVEVKFALLMRERGLTNETIAVNKRPCVGDLGCDTLLGRFLPPGGSLTVHGPAGFKRTYRSTEQDG